MALGIGSLNGIFLVEVGGGADINDVDLFFCQSSFQGAIVLTFAANLGNHFVTVGSVTADDGNDGNILAGLVGCNMVLADITGTDNGNIQHRGSSLSD